MSPAFHLHITTRCPDCGASLRIRRRRSDGEEFVGCSAYPGCRFSADAGDQVLRGGLFEARRRVRELENSLPPPLIALAPPPVIAQLCTQGISIEILRQKSAEDALLREISQYLRSSWPPRKKLDPAIWPYASIADELELADG